MRVCICKIIHCLWVIFMQVASTEWYLGVQIQDFINLYNVEIINGMYCCCDDSETCGSDFDNLLGKCEDPSTTQVCKTSFLVHIRYCSRFHTCFLSKTYQLNYKSSTSMFNYGILSIPFMKMELSYEVKTKISYLHKSRENFKSLQSTV